MKIFTIIAYITVVLTILCSCSEKQDTNSYLITNFSQSETENLKISELLGTDFRIINLNEAQGYSIGRINKVVKRANNFFILSDDKTIFQFDDDGNFISILDKKGGGPGEYNRIEDFDIYEENGELVIWLADFSQIKIYKFNRNWQLSNAIKLPFVINKFIQLKNNQILLMTGQNPNSLTLINNDGNIIKEFLNKEIPFLTLKPVQFVKIDSSIIFPLGMSNSFVNYNCTNQQFGFGKYIKANHFLKRSELLDLYNDYGYDFFIELKKINYIKNIRQYGKNIVIEYSMKNNRLLSVCNLQGESKHINVFPNPSYINDISKKSNPRFLLSMFLTDSDDSLLFLEEPDEINDRYALIEFFAK